MCLITQIIRVSLRRIFGDFHKLPPEIAQRKADSKYWADLPHAPVANSVLRIVSAAFRIDSVDRHRLRWDDDLKAIYLSRYEGAFHVDELEFERIATDLQREFRRDFVPLLSRRSVSIAELVEFAVTDAQSTS